MSRADVRDGPDGSPALALWLSGLTEGLIWKFVRVHDERVAPNRWHGRCMTARPTLACASTAQGNEFERLRAA